MRRYGPLVCLLGGCDLVLGLDRAPIDAAPIDVALANHDEDGDNVDDAIDVCPADADPAQVDSDGDRVGDACDPHVDRPIDRIRWFDSLQDFAANWSTTGPGSWQQLSDAVRQTTAAGGVTVDLALFGGGRLAQPTIEVWIEDAMTTSAEGNAGAFVATSTSNSTGEGVACYRVYGATSSLRLWMKRTPSEEYVLNDASPISPDSRFRVFLQMSSGDGDGPPECQGADAVVQPDPGKPWLGPLDGRALLYTFNASATFLSVTIYERTDL